MERTLEAAGPEGTVRHNALVLVDHIVCKGLGRSCKTAKGSRTW